jgi:glyoxylase-like metal-dependent hydrolase (beta-lactamase superfamily II)
LFEITGCLPEDITIVVNTHLHFDHAGGNTIFRDTGTLRHGGAEIVPQFKNARYFVSTTEFEHAENPHERDRASYRPENWRPLQLTGQLELKPDSYEVVDGLRIEQVRGHSETMQTVKLTRSGETLYGFYDLIPTRHHLSLPWIMSYDLFPAETLEFKKRILPLAFKENWTCLFYHDPVVPLAKLAVAKTGYEAARL